MQARRELLGPIARQQEAIRAYARSRRAVVDVDPDPGETDDGTVAPPIPPTTEPTPAPPPAVSPTVPAPVLAGSDEPTLA